VNLYSALRENTSNALLYVLK